ncbi:glycosyltransferase family 2 protein [Candidatus Pelagibacter sp.]|jgi:glycosyltransferase involved in cell wall biosynthesis|nr:glycosyltransferase family 2 protein [Candidatus Pelagibacter sp.]
MKNLTLIIPAKHESESLPNVLSELQKYDLNILVVLEKTDYETINSIKQFNCQIIYQENKGYGDALILGLEKVRTEYFCIFNADGSFNPNEIMNMYSSLQKKNGDIVFASRYEKNATSEDDTIVTIIGNFIFTLIGKVFFNLPITDILYTFLIGKTNKVKRLNLKSNDFQFCVELPIKAQREKYKIFSIESHERTRIAGKKKVNALKDGFLILKKMVFMFFKR